MELTQKTLIKEKEQLYRNNIYGTPVKYPRHFQLTMCKLKEKDFIHPHPELEAIKHEHNFKGFGDEYVRCDKCRMLAGACIE